MLNFEKFQLKIWRRASGIQVTEDLCFLLENRSWVLEPLGTNKRILILLHWEKCHCSELEHPWRYSLTVPSENWAHPIVLVWSPEFLVGCLWQIEAMTPMSKSYQLKRGCLPRKTTIPHDLRPSCLLLLWHLLHWSPERGLGKPLPYVVWAHGIPPWWQGTLNYLWMSPLALPFYDFSTHMLWHREQKICGLSKEYFPMVPVDTAEFDCMTMGTLPVLYFCGFLGNLFLQTVSSWACWNIVSSSALSFSPRSFATGTPSPNAKVSHVIPALGQSTQLVVSVLQTNCLLERDVRLTRKPTTKQITCGLN